MDDLGEPLSEEESRQLIDQIAREVSKRRLETPAILFFEMNKPLGFIAGQALIVAMPFLGPLLGPEWVARVSRLLQKRENIEKLIQRIEELSDERESGK